MKDKTKFEEPPSIEGYVYRYKPNTKLRVQVYLTVHSGGLFFLNPTQAHAPQPPMPAVLQDRRVDGGVGPAVAFEKEEMKRGKPN